MSILLNLEVKPGESKDTILKVLNAELITCTNVKSRLQRNQTLFVLKAAIAQVSDMTEYPFGFSLLIAYDGSKSRTHFRLGTKDKHNTLNDYHLEYGTLATQFLLSD